eukprot:1570811-Prymnesium_polylepis.1
MRRVKRKPARHLAEAAQAEARTEGEGLNPQSTKAVCRARQGRLAWGGRANWPAEVSTRLLHAAPSSTWLGVGRWAADADGSPCH